MRFFATRTPTISLYCKNGKTVRWPQGGGQGMVAVPPHETEVLECLDRSIARGTGGEIREVTGEEFEAWQKKTWDQPRFPVRERESISHSGATPTSVVQGTSGVPSPSPTPTPAATAEPSQPQAPRPAPAAADLAAPKVAPRVPLRKLGPTP